MNGDILVRCLEVLCGISLLIQVTEYLRIASSSDEQGIWSWPVQRADIPPQPAWVRRFLDAMFQPLPYRLQLWVRGLAAVVLVIQGSSLSLALVLFLGTLLLLLRWRGAFNGGSDFMTLVVLTGLLISQWLGYFESPELGWRACFWYITIQSITSYFVSGAVKLLRPEWRNGSAMTIFLNAAIHGPLSQNHLLRNPWLATLGSWTFILWECAAPLALLDVRLAILFCSVAALFHFLVFWFFGLNRFFWAWMASFPAIVWCAGRLIVGE